MHALQSDNEMDNISWKWSGKLQHNLQSNYASKVKIIQKVHDSVHIAKTLITALHIVICRAVEPYDFANGRKFCSKKKFKENLNFLVVNIFS